MRQSISNAQLAKGKKTDNVFLAPKRSGFSAIKKRKEEKNMKHFVCRTCNFVSLEGKIERCPVCGQSSFDEIENAYKTPDFKAATGESEKKHIPVLSVKHKDVGISAKVKFGEIIHPMMAEHHIEYADFYVNNKYVSRIKFSPAVLPIAKIYVDAKTEGKIEVIGFCNLHGLWFNETQISKKEVING
ncbi:MAG: hypothetical protein LBB93_00055 [Elusimicrobiota bacterium]|jgi:desulfoferrodoxin-like iron-binding protein|nr:hypothetical protein [Elusimicrobiota bacterium]